VGSAGEGLLPLVALVGLLVVLVGPPVVPPEEAQLTTGSETASLTAKYRGSGAARSASVRAGRESGGGGETRNPDPNGARSRRRLTPWLLPDEKISERPRGGGPGCIYRVHHPAFLRTDTPIPAVELRGQSETVSPNQSQIPVKGPPAASFRNREAVGSVEFSPDPPHPQHRGARSTLRVCPF